MNEYDLLCTLVAISYTTLWILAIYLIMLVVRERGKNGQ